MTSLDVHAMLYGLLVLAVIVLPPTIGNWYTKRKP